MTERDLDYLRSRLKLWGRICSALGIGFPSMAATERARIGRGGVFDGPNIPDFLADVDHAVSVAPPQHKLVIVETYTKNGNYRDHAARMQISVDAYYRRRNKAEVYLNTALSCANGSVDSRAS
jgi:hypothetical protein